MVGRLSGELMDAANNRGNAVKNVKTLTKWLKPTGVFALSLVV
ncbi:MAG: hypothetical protein CM15mP100_6350 [Alphaproteobacteria bacterium]|nr:MAG: hypothetical protein CM15mP100_6350 [Alphaproteobacteria bacterium]